MPLWTDLIDPATLSGYARASLNSYEANRGTLTPWLPNRMVPDVNVRFVKGSTGFVDAASFRAYDAEPTIGRRPAAGRVTLELPALGQGLPVSEYDQLRARNPGQVNDQQVLEAIYSATDAVVRATADAMELMRGTVLATGRATINTGGFSLADDFGRSAGNAPTAPTLWNANGATPLSDLELWADVYRNANGVDPGSIVMSRQAWRLLANSGQFSTLLPGGGIRQPSLADVNTIVEGAGLPTITIYDRRVQVNGTIQSAVPKNIVLMLPEAVAGDDWQGTDLGATFWGATLTSSQPDWQIAPVEQPGIVTGVWRNDRPPMGMEIIADAIGLPVLANADRSLAATVF